MTIFDNIRSLFIQPTSKQPLTAIQENALRFYSDNGMGNVGYARSFSDSELASIQGVSATAERCVSYRARTTGATPLMLVDASGEKQTEFSNLDWWMTKNPTRGLQMEWITRSLLLYGHAYLRKKYNMVGGRRGLPTGLMLYNPLMVMPMYRNGMGDVTSYRVQNNDATYEELAVDEMVYIQDFDPDPYGAGVSKFEIAWHYLRTDEYLSKYAAAFFFNGARPDGIISVDNFVMDGVLNKMRADWNQMFSKVNNSHKTAFLPNGVKYTPITGNIHDLDIGSISDTTRVNICMAMEVEPVLIGLKMAADSLSSSSTFGANEVSHILNVTIPFLNNTILAALNEQWLPDLKMADYRLAVDQHKIPALNEGVIRMSLSASDVYRRGLMRSDEARMLMGFPSDPEGLARASDEPLALYQAGSITRNEMRKLIGMDELPEDVVMISGKVYPVDRIAELAHANVDNTVMPKIVPNTPSDPKPPTPSAPAPVDKPAIDKLPDLPAHPRSEMVYQLALQFSDNQFAKSAVRKAQLASTGEVSWQTNLYLPITQITGQLSELVKVTDQFNATMLSAPTLWSSYIEFGDSTIELCFDNGMEEFQAQVDAVLGMFDTTNNQIEESCMTLGVGMPYIASNPDMEFAYPFIGVKLVLMSQAGVLKTFTLKQNNAEIRSELKNWGLKAGRKGAQVHFEPTFLEGTPVLSFLSHVLSKIEDDEVEGAFSLAQDIIAGDNAWRSWDNTEAWFTDTLSGLIRQGLGNKISQKKFAGQIRVALRLAGLRAFQDGFDFAGSPHESYNPEEIAAFKGWLGDQAQFVTKFANEVYKEGLPESEIDSRCQKWANKSLRAVYHLAMQLAGDGALYRWKLGATDVNCPTCSGNDNIIRSFKDWQILGLPQSDSLDCKGYNCECQLVKVS